jgi:hypothetical protein
VRQQERRHEKAGVLRLCAAAATLVVAWLAFFSHLVAPFWPLVPLAGFVMAVFHHQGIRRTLERARRGAAYYQNALARIEDRWAGTGSAGERFDLPHHVYASDLDLFGSGGLFELLSTARTRMGEETLAGWLLKPAPVASVRERHESLGDLRNRLHLREDIAILGEHANVGVRPEALLGWSETPNVLDDKRWIALLALLLPVLAIATFVGWMAWGIVSPFVASLLVNAGVAYAIREPLKRVLEGTEQAFEDLRLFAGLLLRLEKEPFEAEPLRALVRRLSSHTLPASTTIARLSSVVSFMEARRNPILGILEVPLLYSVHTTLAAERWRRAHGAAVREWVSVAGELEALLSIAAYSYGHPDDPMPELVDGGPARFEGTGLAHPLLPSARHVRNDLNIAPPTRVLLVSGSNMSGKSTLLRTVGINTVLAMAGAPVRARSLRLTPLQIGASIRINDSLHEGSSRFYAEITRLRQILALTEGPLPLLFLLDELLQGTNSRDRRVGAEGVVRAFAGKGAIGLISTHDLALTDISGLPEGALRNVHFQDSFEDGRIRFDFHLREGVVTKSNGVELMRSIGLDV